MAGTVDIQLDINPQPKQIEFMLSNSRYTLYGGARGGGKSWSARTKLELLAARYPGIQQCLTRRIRQDLYKNHMTDMIKDLENKEIAFWRDKESAFIFPYCKNSMGVPAKIFFEFCRDPHMML